MRFMCDLTENSGSCIACRSPASCHLTPQRFNGSSQRDNIWWIILWHPMYFCIFTAARTDGLDTFSMSSHSNLCLLKLSICTFRCPRPSALVAGYGYCSIWASKSRLYHAFHFGVHSSSHQYFFCIRTFVLIKTSLRYSQFHCWYIYRDNSSE